MNNHKLTIVPMPAHDAGKVVYTARCSCGLDSGGTFLLKRWAERDHQRHVVRHTTW